MRSGRERREAARRTPGFWPEHLNHHTCHFLRQERRRGEHNGIQFHCCKESLQTPTESSSTASQPHHATAVGFYWSPCGPGSSQSPHTNPVAGAGIMLYARCSVPSSTAPASSYFLSLPVSKWGISTLPGVSTRPLPPNLGQKASRQVIERSTVFLFYQMTLQEVCVPKYSQELPWPDS